MFGALSDTRQRGRSFAKQLSCDRKVARERYQRRLLLATEELLSAQFSIDEVLLTLSSNGEYDPSICDNVRLIESYM